MIDDYQIFFLLVILLLVGATESVGLVVILLGLLLAIIFDL